MATITIDPTLQSLIPPLTPEEADQLEKNLRTDGCRDPLIIWRETQTLLDGHHRLAICERHGLPYGLQEISLPDFAAAKAWMITNQLGRRNLTPDQMSYYRDEQYNLQKQRHGGDRKPEASSTKKGNLKTVDRLAGDHGVSRNTIARDGAYATAVETLAAVLGPDARQAILAGDLQLTRQDVTLLASLVEGSPETATAVREALQGEAPADVLHTIVTAARCGICHRPLSDPASISRGIGPVCAGHGNGSHGPGGGAGTARAAAPPLTERQQARSGPRDEKPPGSIEWCWQTLDLLKIRWQRKNFTDQEFEETLTELCQHEVWKVVPPEQPYGSLERLVATEVGLDLAWFLQDAIRALRDLQTVVTESGIAAPWERTAAGDSVLDQCQALGQAYRDVEQVLRQTFPVFDATVVSPPPAPESEPAPGPSAEGERPPDPAAPAIPAYDQAKFVLGKLCPGQHVWGQTGKTLLRKNGRYCPRCNAEKKRQASRKETHGDGV